MRNILFSIVFVLISFTSDAQTFIRNFDLNKSNETHRLDAFREVFLKEYPIELLYFRTGESIRFYARTGMIHIEVVPTLNPNKYDLILYEDNRNSVFLLTFTNQIVTLTTK
jgi:hypothetical protein